MTIRRHAKISPKVRIHGLVQPLGLVDVIGGLLEFHTVLTPLGVAVKEVL